MFLTKSTTFIIGPVAELIGIIMNGIFYVLSTIGLPNVGLAIIIMTILIYMAMLPLTIRQQKFSKLQRKMQPEISKIQKKYKGRTDNASVAAQQEEIKQVYDKYGVSATGSCVQLLIQMPILFALYRVFYNIPAYLPLVKEAFSPLVENLYKLDPTGAILTAQNSDGKYIFSSVSQFARNFSSEAFTSGDTTYIKNVFIDVLNKFQAADWKLLTEKASSLSGDIATTTAKLNQYNNFLGISIAESPSNLMRQGGIMIVVALIIPFLAAFTQWLNVKLMPQADTSANDQAANTMKSMNIMMPIMSAVFCFSLPSGMGLYWIIGAVVRIVQQIFINKHIDKMDIDGMIEKNSEKAKEKAEKRKEKAKDQQDKVGTERTPAGVSRKNRLVTKLSPAQEKKIEEMNQTRKTRKFKEGSLSEQADMVRRFNEYNN
ncbi:MAG: YidC/Oxa1 family membrane protein insertase [Sarcina sp.]|nr:YidC/Oxa1 family membrane protein insertase [Sarcina sp.]